MKNITKNEYKIKSKQMSVKPFVFTRPSVSSVSIRFLILLLLQVIMLVITKSFNALFVVSVSTLGALLAATLDYIINKCEPYKILNIVIQGLLIGLLLPDNYPVISVFFISFIVIFISKSFIFNKVNPWINISALTVVIAWFIGQRFFPEFSITSDLVGLKNSSVYLIQNGTFPICKFDSIITSFFNNHILRFFNTTIPEGFISMFWDTHSAIPAFRFNLLTIISSIVIFADNSFSGVIPSIFLLVYALLVRLFSAFIFGGMFNQGDVLLAILSSGTLFCSVFLLQWFSSCPITIIGKIIQGIILGGLAFAICGCGTSPIGMVYTILIGNISNIIIRVIEEKHNSRIISKTYINKSVQGEI